MAHAIVVKHSKHSSCFHMRFNINKVYVSLPNGTTQACDNSFIQAMCWCQGLIFPCQMSMAGWAHGPPTTNSQKIDSAISQKQSGTPAISEGCQSVLRALARALSWASPPPGRQRLPKGGPPPRSPTGCYRVIPKSAEESESSCSVGTSAGSSNQSAGKPYLLKQRSHLP